MSQVKKLQSGGGTPPTGRFRMNGLELVGLDALNGITPYLGENTARLVDAINDGMITGYNPANNSPYILDPNTGEDRTLEYLSAFKGISPTDSIPSRVAAATFNTLKHRATMDALKLKNVNMRPYTEKKEEIPVKKSRLRRGYGFFDYKDDNGTLTYRETPENIDREAVLQEFRKYIEGLADEGEDNINKNYDLGE